ncbi:MAG: DNA internalization-related competence protein ComEC/Rec2 [Aristaeellaceae bacterium]
MNERQERLLAWALPMATAALVAGILIGRASDSAVFGWTALLCASGAAMLTRDRMRRAVVLMAVCALGCALGQIAYHPTLPEEGYYAVTGIVTGEIRHGDKGQIKTELRHVTLDGESAGNAYWSFYLNEGEELPEGLVPGAQVSMMVRLYHPDGADNPDGYDFREYLLQQGVTIGLYGREALQCADAPFTLDGFAASLRHRLTEGLTQTMGTEAGGYAAAMLLGVKSLVPSEDRAAFSRLGIAHVLSISGFHVGVLAGMAGWLLGRLRASRKVRAVCIAVLMAAYCLLTGMHPPVVRAALLLMLHEYGQVRCRQRSSVHLLCASMMLMLLVNPCQLTGASFQLTYGAVLGLTLVSPALRRLLDPPDGWRRRLWQTCCATLGAQIGLLPAELYWFGELPLLGLALNLVIFAVAAGMMLLYWLTMLLLPIPVLAAVAGRVAALVTSALAGAVRFLGGLNAVTLWTKQANLLTLAGWCLLMLGIMYLSPLTGRRRLMAGLTGAAVLLISLIPLPYGGTTYIQFSVGNGDAALIRDRDAVVVIDTGEDGFELSRYLHHRRLSVDTLILTHLHADHAGGIAALIEDRIPVARCLIAPGAQEADVMPEVVALLEQLARTGTEIAVFSRGDVLPLPSGSLTALWPEEGRVRPGMDANLSSMALLAEMRGMTLLLTGDLDGRYAHYIAMPADVLKLAHHGAAADTPEDFLAAVDPGTLLISTGDRDRLANVEERCGSIPAFSTASHGALTLEFNDAGYTLTTFK